uniref:Putative ovule protein n=1 Tax=Solanum chacoense TaxID=4108 RepID=A0A0V0GQF9_SOLCH
MTVLGSEKHRCSNSSKIFMGACRILQKYCIFGVFDTGAAMFLESPCNIAEKKVCPGVQFSRTVLTNSSQWNENAEMFCINVSRSSFQRD